MIASNVVAVAASLARARLERMMSASFSAFAVSREFALAAIRSDVKEMVIRLLAVSGEISEIA